MSRVRTQAGTALKLHPEQMYEHELRALPDAREIAELIIAQEEAEAEEAMA